MEQVTIRVDARTYTGAFSTWQGKLTVTYDNRQRTAERGGLPPHFLAGLLLTELVRTAQVACLPSEAVASPEPEAAQPPTAA